MEVGQTVFSELDTSDNTNLQGVNGEYGIRIHIAHSKGVVECDIGTHKGEIGPVQYVAEGEWTSIPFMVAESRQIKSYSVHQFIHGFAGFGIAVVDRVARAVVAGAKYQ